MAGLKEWAAKALDSRVAANPHVGHLVHLVLLHLLLIPLIHR